MPELRLVGIRSRIQTDSTATRRQLSLEVHDVLEPGAGSRRVQTLQDMLTSRGFAVQVKQDERMLGTNLYMVLAKRY